MVSFTADDQTADHVLTALSSSAHVFLKPPPDIHIGSLALAKRYLDPLAAATSELQVQRQQEARKKRKRGTVDPYETRNILRLRQIHIDGFKIEQIWEQASRAIDASRLELERTLRRQNLFDAHNRQPDIVRDPGDRESEERPRVHFEKDASELDASDVGSDDFDADSATDIYEITDALNQEDDEVIGTEALTTDDLDEYDGDFVGHFDPEAEPDEVDTVGQFGSGAETDDVFIPDKHGLNDGFFSIDDFNRQSDFLENQDARGENDGAASDEEDVDWTTDPLMNGSLKPLTRNGEDEAKAGESDEEDTGPTFGNAVLTGEDPSDSEAGSNLSFEDAGTMNNTNEIKYADFFAAPPRKLTKSDRRRALPKTQPPPSDMDEGMQRTISAVRRDIFEDDLTASEASDGSASNPNRTQRSSHQKRQAALTAEIQRLEAAAIAKRDWTLSGEARAADRPINSLLEEDLDFERVGKPVPVITQEVSEDIEALIKRRILAREFDEVIRRRPGNLATGGGKESRRGLFELSDAKPEQSLAEVYEAEHLQKTDPSGHPSKTNEKLKAEHAKIEALWKEVSAKLDALSSWHYRPKPPSAEVTVVADVPAISMEDARPAAGGDVGGESMLAPQEIYKAGEKRDKVAEVVTGSGLPVGRAEMTREEKLRRRRREKERIRKAGGLAPGQGGKAPAGGKKAEEKSRVVKDLQKGGVKVIGKKGELRGVDGRIADQQIQRSKGAGAFKL